MFGTIGKRRTVVRKAVYYGGGRKTLTGIDFRGQRQFTCLKNRRRAIARKLHLRFLSCFHSHMKIRGYVQKTLSQDDINFFLFDKEAPLEFIVCVWSDNNLCKRSKTAVTVRKAYNYRIQGYRKTKNAVRRIAVKR